MKVNDMYRPYCIPEWTADLAEVLAPGVWDFATWKLTKCYNAEMFTAAAFILFACIKD